MPVRHVDIIGQRRAGELAADGSHVDDLMENAEPCCAGCRVIQFFSVSLAVVEGDQPEQFLLDGYSVGKRNAIQSAGADDNGLHIFVLVLSG